MKTLKKVNTEIVSSFENDFVVPKLSELKKSLSMENSDIPVSVLKKGEIKSSLDSFEVPKLKDLKQSL